MQPKLYLTLAAILFSLGLGYSQNLIVNPSAESPLSTGWTIVSKGTDCNGSSDWRVQGGTNGFPVAKSGSYIFFSGCNYVKGVIYQDIDVSSLATDIDDGNINFTFLGYMQVANEDPADGGQMVVEYKNAAGVTLVSYNTGIQKVKGVWTPYTSTLTAPEGVRKVRVSLKSYTYNGSSVDAYFDDLSLIYMKIVPLKLISFDVVESPKGVASASWKTANEMNNDYFELQRSGDGRNWEAIAKVKGAGTSNVEHSYTSKDTYPLSGQSFYRLKQVDLDGKWSVSPVKTFKSGGSNLAIRVFPNPASTIVTIEGNAEAMSGIRLYNAAGVELTTGVKIVNLNSSKKEIHVSALPKGLYFVRSNSSSVSFYKN